MDYDNPYCKVVRGDANKATYIIFSSVDIEKGKFMFWKIANRMQGNKIFINDEGNGWYVHGIPGMGHDVRSSANALISILKKIGSAEVILIGPSMGGYGAMLYGSIIKILLPSVDVRCISFGGEFLLYTKETRSRALTKKAKNNWFADLRMLLAVSMLNVTHIYGDNDINDVFQATLVNGLHNINLISISNGPHAISNYIAKHQDLTRILNRFECENIFYVDGVSRVSQSVKHGALLFQGHMLMLENNPIDAIESLRKAVELMPDHALSRHKYGQALLLNKQMDEALLQQEAAVVLNKNLAHAHFHIAIISEGLGFIDKALHHYQECLNIEPTHKRAMIALNQLQKIIM